MPTLTTAEISRLLNGTLCGSGEIIIRGVAKIEEASREDLTFVANPTYARFLETTKAGVVLVKKGVVAPCPTIEVVDPYAAFLQLLEMMHPRAPWLYTGIHPSAVIDSSASIGENVAIGALSYIGPRSKIGSNCMIFPHAIIAADVVIGEGCEIHSHVSVREHVHLGNRVVLQDGVVVGGDGFGFVPDTSGYRKIPHLGTVIIEDDVEIGANTTIDRASIGETRIGAGTKLDNLIQIAHNVTIGRATVIAAQTGVSGSAKIGDRCRIGGQVGIVGHISIGNDVQIGAKSGIAADTEDGQVVSGAPARPHSLWKRIEVLITQLPDWIKRIRALESAVYSDSNKPKV